MKNLYFLEYVVSSLAVGSLKSQSTSLSLSEAVVWVSRRAVVCRRVFSALLVPHFVTERRMVWVSATGNCSEVEAWTKINLRTTNCFITSFIITTIYCLMMLSPSLFLHSAKPLLYWFLPVSLKGTAWMNQWWTTLQSYEYPAITLCLDCPERPELHLQTSFHSSTLFPLSKGDVAETRVSAKPVCNGDSGFLMASAPHSCQCVLYILLKAISACSVF